MKILLINPPAETFKLGNIPSGLAYIASVARERKCQVNIAELEPNFTEQELRKIIHATNPDLVGISVMTLQIVQAFKAAKFIKKISQDIITVIGGVHVSALPDTTLRNPYIDIIVHGEGEETFGLLLDRISSGKSFKDLQGIGYKENGNLMINPPRELVSDLDRIPFPAFDLFDYARYSEGSIVSSRGCPFRCKFCASSIVHGHKLRFRSAQNIVDEMELLNKKYHYEHIRFWDDTFTANKNRVVDVCEEILKRKLSVTWSCYAHVVTIDKKLLEKMKGAGCCYLEFGIETGSPRVQKILNKNLDLNRVREVMKLVHAAGLGIKTDFMIGSPDETKEEMYQTFKLAIDLDPDIASFAILVPYPGTELYNLIKKDSFPEDYWNKFIHSPLYADVVSAQFPLLSNHLTRSELDKLVRQFHRKFYFRPKYILSRLFIRGFYHTNGRPLPPVQKIRKIKEVKILLTMVKSLLASFTFTIRRKKS